MCEYLLRNRLLSAGLLALLVLASGLISAYKTEYANGWDGYYYLVQIRSFTETGVMHSPEYSPVYIPMLALRYLTGSCITAGKVSAVLIKLMFVLSVFYLSLSLLRSAHREKREISFIAALLTAAVSSASPSLNYFFLQFPKNLMGFSFFFLFVACVLSTAGGIKQRGRGVYGGTAGSVLFFLAAFFTHRFTAVLSLLFLVLFLASYSRKLLVRMSSRGKTPWIAIWVIIFIVFVLILSNTLPLALSTHDMERITGDLAAVPVFVPAAFMEVFGVHRLNPEWIIEIFIASVLPAATLLLLPWVKRFSFLRLGRGYYILCLIGLIGLFPFLEFSLTGLSYRLFFGTLLMLPLIGLPYLLLAAEKWLVPCLRSGKPIRKGLPVLVLLSVAALSFYTGRSYRPEIHDPPYALYEEIAENAMSALDEEEFDLIIAHRSLAEFITFRYRVDVLPWAPEEHFQRDRVWRITAGILGDEVSYYLSPDIAETRFVRLGGDYGLLREDHWETFVEKVSDDPVMMEAVEVWRNPLAVRPAFLVGNR